MKNAVVLTLGCKTNQYEGDVLRRRLAAMGYRVAGDGAAPDLAIVNTCTVTVRADRKCRQLIRKIARRHPNVPIYVTGCYVPRKADDLAGLAGVAGVAADKDDLLRMISRNEHVAPADSGTELSPQPGRRTRAFLKIQDGCDAFCSYCIVPYVRPRLHSEPIDRVLAEARRLVNAGYREIVLTGIHLGRYGADRTGGATLTDVIRRAAQTPGLARLRLSSIEHPELPDELIELIAESPVICPHLHLPLQSGDDGVLAAMNRRYTAGDFLQTVSRIRDRIPDASVTTDVIAGFPGETDAAFQSTLCVCRDAGFSKMHVFPYSVRPGTAAAQLPGRLPARVITARKKELIRAGDELALEYKKRFVGRTVEVLVEEAEPDADRYRLTGLTEHYMRVRFPSNISLHNEFVSVKIERVTPEAMSGRAP